MLRLRRLATLAIMAATFFRRFLLPPLKELFTGKSVQIPRIYCREIVFCCSQTGCKAHAAALINLKLCIFSGKGGGALPFF